MTERGLPAEGAPACPFVAFEDDRDGRSTAPDHRHRCFAEARPAPRAVAHQEAYCLSSAFPVCPTFQDWARREAAAARPAPPPVAAPREEPPQSPLPPAERDARRAPVADTPAPVPPRRSQPRDWAAPPPWAEDGGVAGATGQPGGPSSAGAGAGALWGPNVIASDVPAVPSRDGGRDAGRDARQPDAWGSDARGLAGSAAHRLAGPDPDEPEPAVPEGFADPRDDPDARYDLDPRDPRAQLDPGDAPDDDRNARYARPSRGDDLDADWAAGAGAYVAGSAVARDARPVQPDDARYGPPSRRPAGGPRPDGRRPDDRSRGASRRGQPQPSGREPARRPPQQDAQELFGPAWERPRRYEAYPSLRTRIGLPRLGGVPRIAVWAIVLVLAALLLFLFGPSLLGIGGKGGGTAASPTPRPSAVATATPEPTVPPAPTPQVYIVKQGDLLSNIAKRFGIPLKDLLAANPQIKNPNKIAPGDKITIPVPDPETGFPTDSGTVEGASAVP